MTSDVKIKYRFCIKQVRSDELTTQEKTGCQPLSVRLSEQTNILMTQFTLFCRNLALQIPYFVIFLQCDKKKHMTYST